MSAHSIQAALGLDDIDYFSAHVSEIFSPDRFVHRATDFGLLPGTAMDLRTGWNFDLAADQENNFYWVLSTLPYSLSSLPSSLFPLPCGP